MAVYVAWGVSEGIFSIFVGLSLSLATLSAAQNLHRKVLKRVLSAPIKFFDTTPIGRILNRFSKDIDVCDNIITQPLQLFLCTIADICGIFILTSIVFVYFLVPAVPLLFLYYYYANYFRKSNRELVRLDSILRALLYAQFTETLTGLPIIRAYRVQETFLRTNEQYLDNENCAYILYNAVSKWLSVRVESIANLLIYVASLLCVYQRFNVDPSIVGVILSYSMVVTADFAWCIKQLSEVESTTNSVERLVYYIENVESEPDPIIPGHRPPSEWPTKGEIMVKDLVMKYGPEKPIVIKEISLHIKGSESIGIVGRTGCGKSTLATSFFRFIEPTSGQIIVDDIDITTIGLKDLRSKITIIPQDPVLFNGTIRSNLDPFNLHDDQSLYNALRRAHLFDDEYVTEGSTAFGEKNENSRLLSPNQGVSHQKIHLDLKVHEHGRNFSQGQQQLIALARALVRRSKIIIMDEATASVDFRTDHLIQETIREEFSEATVITIAHRLRTVMDYDRVLVLDKGSVIEFESPYLLLQNPKSMFRGMCELSGEFENLMKIAKQKYEKGTSLNFEKKQGVL